MPQEHCAHSKRQRPYPRLPPLRARCSTTLTPFAGPPQRPHSSARGLPASLSDMKHIEFKRRISPPDAEASRYPLYRPHHHRLRSLFAAGKLHVAPTRPARALYSSRSSNGLLHLRKPQRQSGASKPAHAATPQQLPQPALQCTPSAQTPRSYRPFAVSATGTC